MKLSALADAINARGIDFETDIYTDTEITNISFDSRRCKKGSLFFCKGRNFRPAFAAHAIQNGAAAVCAEASSEQLGELKEITRSALSPVPLLIFKNIRRAMAVCSDEFFGKPFSSLKAVAVTGTKGKSTTVCMINNILNEAPNMRSAILNELVASGAPELTTPEAPDFYYAAARCVKEGYTHIVCEISSQAVKEERFFGAEFDIGCFLNLDADHISPYEHNDEAEYFDCKKKLFAVCRSAVLNADCAKSNDIAEYIKRARPESAIYTFSFEKNCTYKGSKLRKTPYGCIFSAGDGASETELCITSGGIWNSENALCAYGVGRYFGVDNSGIFRGILATQITGRTERIISDDEKIEVIVDYAHNKLSFEAIFKYAEALGRKMTAVFGCPGEKAFCRRYQLPETALIYADRIIITEDDSGCEGFENIKNEILKNIGIICKNLSKAQCAEAMSKISVIPDRKTAIRSSIESAYENQEDRTILLLGKGSCRTMISKNGTVPYEGDTEISRRAIAEINEKLIISAIGSASAGSGESLVILSEDENSLNRLLEAMMFLPNDVKLAAVCEKKAADKISELCFKLGKLPRIIDTPTAENIIFGNGIHIYIAPEKENIRNFAKYIAENITADALVYISSARGIMLNGRTFVKKLSLQSAKEIEKYTKTSYLAEAVGAIENGVGRCLVLDGESELSLSKLFFGLTPGGSEIIR